MKVAKSELNHYPKLKYIPEGTHYLYCRAYKEESGHTEKYGEWSEGFLLKVNIKTPNAPVVQKLQVKKMTLKLSLAVIQKNWMVMMLLLPEVKTGMSHQII